MRSLDASTDTAHPPARLASETPRPTAPARGPRAPRTEPLDLTNGRLASFASGLAFAPPPLLPGKAFPLCKPIYLPQTRTLFRGRVAYELPSGLDALRSVARCTRDNDVPGLRAPAASQRDHMVGLE